MGGPVLGLFTRGGPMRHQRRMGRVHVSPETHGYFVTNSRNLCRPQRNLDVREIHINASQK
jgi:hypothetical protein